MDDGEEGEESGGGVDIADAELDEDTAESKRSRRTFSWLQIATLEHVFELDPLPRQVRGGPVANPTLGFGELDMRCDMSRAHAGLQVLRKQIGDRIGISARCIQVWFQNRRQKWKQMYVPNGHSPPPFRNLSMRLSNLDNYFPPGWPGTIEKPAISPTGCLHVSMSASEHSPPLARLAVHASYAQS